MLQTLLVLGIVVFALFAMSFVVGINGPTEIADDDSDV